MKKENGKLKTINIKGSDYVTVNVRLLEAHRLYSEKMSIVTDIIHCDENTVRVKAVIKIDTGEKNSVTGEPIYRIYTGHAEELRAEGYINKTSAVENCETSAVGRALGMLGIGISESVASKEEIEIAKAKETYLATHKKTKSEKKFEDDLKYVGTCANCGVELTEAESQWCMDRLKDYGGKLYCRKCQNQFYRNKKSL